MKDYYRILEVHPQASPEVITKAYRALVQKHHPDHYHGNHKEAAVSRMQDINEAYNILSDEAERRRYDRRYRMAPSNASGASDRKANMALALRKVLTWAAIIIFGFLLLRTAGRFLFLTPIGKLLLLGLAVWVIIRTLKRRRTS